MVFNKVRFSTDEITASLTQINKVIENDNIEELLFFNTNYLKSFYQFLSELDAKLSWIEKKSEERTSPSENSEDPQIIY